MLEHHVEARFEHAMAEVFAALVRELAAGRWSDAAIAGAHELMPRAGLRFGYRHARRLYSGEVLECLRPVSLIIVEQYCGPAVSIVARQRWHVDPLESATRLRGIVRVEPNRFARLQLKFWKAHFASAAQRTCSRVGVLLRHAPQAKVHAARLTPGGHSATTGNRTGSASIVSAKTTSVSGRPILR